MKKVVLSNKVLAENTAPYIIAEIGVNHEGSLEKAKELIRLAKEGGADAAKFQSYKAGLLASKHSPAYWDISKEPTLNQYQLFKKYDHFKEDDYICLAQYCQEIGIDFLSTPFDDHAIEYLYPLIPFYKIASADITNIPFLRKIAKKKKPVLLSTGASSLAEIDMAVKELRHHGCSDLVLLHCVLNYPTSNSSANIGMIQGLQRAFPDVIVGYSDHTLPTTDMMSLVTAYLLGARVIEKHFTHDKTLVGNDHYHAMDVQDLKNFKNNVQRVMQLVGSHHKNYIPDEMVSRQNARRSIVIDKAMESGTIIDESMITYKRPGTGISPLHWDDVIGRQVNRPLEKDHVLQWGDLT